jgi:hypothetical protein
MAKKLTKKTKEILPPAYIPPPECWYFYVGQKYYRRLQPIPYKKDNIPEYLKKYAQQSS